MEILVRLSLVRLSLLAVFLPFAALSSAQDINARVSGRALDETGSGVPFAVIDFLRDNVVVVTTRADLIGAFTTAVPAGTYMMRIEAPGFAVATRAIDLATGTAARTDLTLRIASLSEQIQVLPTSIVGPRAE